MTVGTAGLDDADSRDAVVGRVRQRILLGHWIGEISRSVPRVIVLTGEPGIGKSVLARWAMAQANRRGFSCLYGAGQQDVAVPYLALATALSPLAHATDVATAVFEPGRALLRADQTDTPQLELFLRTADRFSAHARRQPTLLVVEDLHWADPLSQDVLSYLISVSMRDGASLTAGVLVTVRPGEDERADRTVARLQLESACRSLSVPPLDEVEVGELLRATLGVKSTPSFTREVLGSSRGLPLVARSLAGELVRTGQAVVRGGYVRLVDGYLSGSVMDLDVAVGVRIEKLSNGCLETLTRAAVLGDDREIAELDLVSDVPTDLLLAQLEEADEAGILRVEGTRYRFEHPHVRSAILAGTPRRRLERLHVSVADRLETNLIGEPTERSLRVFDHLERAGRACPPERLAEAAFVAGEHALRLAAWPTAAHAFTLALQHRAEGLWDDATKARVHLLAGTAFLHDNDWDRMALHCNSAIDLARACGSTNTWGAAALVLARPMINGRIVSSRLDLVGSALDDFLAESGEREPHLRAAALALKAEAAFVAFDPEEGLRRAAVARRIAAEVGDDDCLASVEMAEGLQRMATLDLERAEACFQRLIDRSAGVTDRRLPIWGHGRLALVHMAAGRFDAAERATAEAVRVADAEHNLAEIALSLSCRSALAAARGQFLEAEEFALQGELLMRASNYVDAALVLYPALALARVALGRRDEAHAALDHFDELTGLVGVRYRVLVDLLAGDVEAAARWLPSATWRHGVSSPPTIYNVGAAVAAVELGAAIADSTLLESGHRVLDEARRRGAAWILDWPTSIARGCAVAAAALGVGDVEDGFDVAVKVNDDAGARWEAARARVDWARVIVRADGPTPRASELLDEAVSRFDALGAIGVANIARRIGRSIGLQLADGGPPLRVILMTDVVGSTETNHRLGDELYLETLRVHNRLTRQSLREHRGVEIKHTGDGFNAWFASASDALRCAVALQEDFARWRQDEPDFSLQIRCGVAAGRPLADGEDLFGVALSEAARLCAAASPGAVFVSSATRALVVDDDIAFVPTGDLSLKGFAEPVAAWSVHRPSIRSPEPV